MKINITRNNKIINPCILENLKHFLLHLLPITERFAYFKPALQSKDIMSWGSSS
jgi:hypothetical protein